MNTNSKDKLTAGEISQLYSTYMSDSFVQTVLQHFEKTTDDDDILSIVRQGLQIASQASDQIKIIFQGEGLPVPLGFSKDDVNLQAPKLYTDSFIAHYIKHMAGHGVMTYGLALSFCPREDVRQFFHTMTRSAAGLLETSMKLLARKGLLVKPPYIPYPESMEFVHKEGFLNALLGGKRPLNSLEITNIYQNTLINSLGKTLITGFMQVTKSEDLKVYFKRGKDISSKHIEVLTSMLRADDLPAVGTWESEVTDSTEAPYSDRLMLSHVLFLLGAGVASYGNAVSTSMRRDLSADYSRLIGEIATYLDDGAELMIGMGWMQKIPAAVNREALSGV